MVDHASSMTKHLFLEYGKIKKSVMLVLTQFFCKEAYEPVIDCAACSAAYNNNPLYLQDVAASIWIKIFHFRTIM